VVGRLCPYRQYIDRARQQVEHLVVLLRSLVTAQKWAQTYVQTRGAIEVAAVDEVVQYLASPDRVRRASEQRQQLTLSLL